MTNTEADFWDKVDMRDPSECWLWKGSVRDKQQHLVYGVFNERRAAIYAHRYAYQKTNRVSVLPQYVVRHTCDVPLCCNPNHMVLGTRGDNMADMVARNRANRPRGELSPRAVWSDAERLTIVSEHAQLPRQNRAKILAEKYGCTPRQICYLVRDYKRRSYK